MRIFRGSTVCASFRLSGLTFLLGLIGTASTLAAPFNVSSDQTLSEDTTASYDSISVSNGAVLTIGGGSGITVTGAVTVTGNSSIVFAGKNVDAQVDGEWQGEGSSLTAASVTVDAGSAIHADGQGYTSGKGPGRASTAVPIQPARATAGSERSLPGRSAAGLWIDARTRRSWLGVRGLWCRTYGGGAIRLIVSGHTDSQRTPFGRRDDCRYQS